MQSLNLYRNRKASLGLAAKMAGVSLSEFLDLLEEYHIPLNLDLEEAKEAMRHAEEEL